jgi:repressor LexA
VKKIPTSQQNRVLDFIQREVAVRGNSPTYREIAEAFGFRSPRAAVDHVEALARKGYLCVHRRRSRGIEVLMKPADTGENTFTVPFLGRIAAGSPTDAAEERAEPIRVDKTVLGTASKGPLFALRVVGDSMTGRGIYEGDIAVAEADVKPRIGDVVVALIDRESTLKTLAQGLDGGFLKAENPRYPDLLPVTEMTIQGVVRTLIRKLG